MAGLENKRNKFNKRTPSPLAAIKAAELEASAEIQEQHTETTQSAEKIEPPKIRQRVSLKSTNARKELRNDLLDLMEEHSETPGAIGAKVPRSVYKMLQDEAERLDLQVGHLTSMAIAEFAEKLKSIK